MVCTPLGLDVTAPQAYALVGVAGMLAALCQVSSITPFGNLPGFVYTKDSEQRVQKIYYVPVKKGEALSEHLV